MTLLKKMMLAASLFLVSNFASAAVYDFGTGLNENIEVPSTQLVAGMSSAGPFADFFNFTLTDDSIFSQELQYLPEGFTVLGFSIVEAGTMNVVGAATTIAGALSIDDLFLSAGNYTTNVLGLFDGGFGAYSLTSTVSPVPEASTLAMLLGGLGLVGFMARRRKTA